MHELSIVMSILEIARQQAEKAGAANIEEIELDIGCLSTVEPAAFDFAWEQAIRGTLLQNAKRKINRPEGKARCLACGTEFPVQQLFDPCPACGEFLTELTAGKQLRVKSLLVS